MEITEEFLKIISKAESNGFSFRKDAEIDNIEYIGMGRFNINLTITHKEKEESVEEKVKFTFNIYEVFFNHNFAKTFFGTHEICSNCKAITKGVDWGRNCCSSCETNFDENKPIESWKLHLQEMVVEEDIIKYLMGKVG